MGSRADLTEILSHCKWSEEGSYLGEIAKNGFPCIAKVTRGQYLGLGQPSFSNSSLASYVLLVSAGKHMSVAAQCVKFKNAKQRVVPYGPGMAIPQSYSGHFEILSEDGRSVPCIQSVAQLTRKMPDSCLVREAIKGYKPESTTTKTPVPIIKPAPNNKTACSGLPDNLALATETPGANQLTAAQLMTGCVKLSEKSRLVQPGEILVLVGEVSVPIGKSKVSRYLRCFDSKGQTVYLNSSQKGKFSPLARQDSISGVHITKNILNKRMPIMVRLVDGKYPVMTSSKSSFKFVPELRLFSVLNEELIFGLPLSIQGSNKDTFSIIPLPISVPLKFQVCRNMVEVEQMKEFSRLNEKMKTLVEQHKDLIQIYDISMKKELRFDGRQWKSYTPEILPSSITMSTTASNQINGCGGGSNKDNTSSSGDNSHTAPNNNHPTVVANNNGHNQNNYEIPDVQDCEYYEDIDQIYDYVRGIKPPPERKVSITANTNSSGNNNHNNKLQSKSSNNNNKNVQQQSKPIVIGMPRKISNATASTSTPCTTPSPDLVIPPVMTKHRMLQQRRSSSFGKSLENLISDSPLSTTPPPPPPAITKSIVKDDRPEPPPIETIPTNKNKINVSKTTIGNGACSGGVTVKVMTVGDKTERNVGHHNHHLHQMSSSTKNLLAASTTSSSGGHCSTNNSNTTNTSGSSVSARGSSSGSAGDQPRRKPLYIKKGICADTAGNGLSGSPSNRLIFRRSPIFDCRYKSMNDINRSSLESTSGSSHSKSSFQQFKNRYFHQHSHHHLGSTYGSSAGNLLNLNLLNLNMNFKGSSRHVASASHYKSGGIFRPKSLTNINFEEIGNGISSSPNGGLLSGCKKKLDMVVPSHHHAIHTPPPPPIELLNKIVPRNVSQSQRCRKATLYL